MSNTKRSAPEVRELLAQAQRAAIGKDPDRALALFTACTRDCLARQHFFKAIAVSRRARTVLGPIPKVRALIIRTYRAAGFMGDAREELDSAAAFLRKDELPFLADLDDDAFLDLLSIMETVTCRAGRTVLKRQDPGDDVYVVLSGSCKVTRDGRTLAVLHAGDVFGEIGFFGTAGRSATVRALEKTSLIRLTSSALRGIMDRHPCLIDALDRIYGERILKKTGEDLEGSATLDMSPEVISMLHYAKGQEIPVSPPDSVAILKHGIVEVDYGVPCLSTKRHLKPGSVISRTRSRALASTDVVVMLARVKGMPDREREEA